MTDRPPLDRLDAAREVLIEHAESTKYHAFRHRLISAKILELNAEILLRVRRGEAQA